MIRGSKAYELHSTDWNETFMSVGAPEGARYGPKEYLAQIRKHAEDPAHMESLTWLSDREALGLDKGDVVVQSLETYENGR